MAGMMLGLLAVPALQLIAGIHAVKELITHRACLYAIGSVLKNDKRGVKELI